MASGIPYTIVRSTQFLEFLRGIADSSADGNLIRLPPVLFQPIGSDDVAASVADVALAPPHNGIVEIAGPERAPFNEIVARYLKAIGDPREVVSDPEARYWGGRGRAALARAVGRSAPRPRRFRRMAPPLTGSSLIPHPRYARSVRAGPGQRTKEATMTIKLVALVLLCLMTGTAVAQEPKVTSLMSKDLPENPGREALMITVEHAPGGSSAIHRHNAHAFVYVLEGSVVMQLKGGNRRH